MISFEFSGPTGITKFLSEYFKFRPNFFTILAVILRLWFVLWREGVFELFSAFLNYALPQDVWNWKNLFKTEDKFRISNTRSLPCTWWYLRYVGLILIMRLDFPILCAKYKTVFVSYLKAHDEDKLFLSPKRMSTNNIYIKYSSQI